MNRMPHSMEWILAPLCLFALIALVANLPIQAAAQPAAAPGAPSAPNAPNAANAPGAPAAPAATLENPQERLERVRKHREKVLETIKQRQEERRRQAEAQAGNPWAAPSGRVVPGIDVLLTERIDLIAGKRVGLLTNPSGITMDGRSSIDALHEAPNVNLVALFAPEHGVRGTAYGGDKVTSGTDPQSGVFVYSIYGKTNTPKVEWLKQLDVLVYDIQDTGNRSYTFYCTMANAMKAAREAGITFIVCDRPNPMSGNLVDGNILDVSKGTSLVGCFPIAYFYGMTPGELARMINEEFGVGCKLEVVKMKGWSRSMVFGQTGLLWVPPSQHVPRFETAYYMGITGTLGELHTVNEGVGYTLPFETLGAPWINGDQLADALNARNLPGLFFRPMSYMPRYATYKDQLIHGVEIHITDFSVVRPIEASVDIMEVLQKLYPEKNPLGVVQDPLPADPEKAKEAKAARARVSMFNKVMGTDQVRLDILAGKSAVEVISSWQPAVKDFMAKRAKYLIYQ